MLWLLFLTLPFPGGSVPVTPAPSPGRESVGIVGGCDVSGWRYPWQVSLRFYDMRLGLWQHECGGSLIHPQWVLTAAHCVEPEDLEACAFRVQVGQLRLYDHDQLHKVAEIIRHPKFNASLSAWGGADIALLRLEAPVMLSEHVNLVSLPPASLRVPARKMCWVTGWGDIADNSPLPPPYHLQEVEIPVVGNEECNRHYQNASESSDQVIKADMLCAGSEGRDSCQMLWLLFVTLPCLGGSVPVTPGPGLGPELVGTDGDHDIPAGKWPWQVSLRVFNEECDRWQHECGGSLVHPQWVLTAAHCVGLEPQKYRVQMGQLRLYDHDQLHNVTEIICHPKFNVSLSAWGGADIALLRLEAPVTLSQHVNPVSLAPDSLVLSPGTKCWVTGWGTFGAHALPSPAHRLQEAEVPIVENQVCEKIYRQGSPAGGHGSVIKKDMLCAGRRGRGSRQGDAGGPLVCFWLDMWIQVGVLSWGMASGHIDYPAVYTSVMTYSSWIYQHVPLWP
uniref:mastin-like n=1 Tax=Panthera onca TaxID=9690 RepID=UPI002955D15E|nr:mastin-like [Panthera onca]